MAGPNDAGDDMPCTHAREAHAEERPGRRPFGRLPHVGQGHVHGPHAHGPHVHEPREPAPHGHETPARKTPARKKPARKPSTRNARTLSVRNPSAWKPSAWIPFTRNPFTRNPSAQDPAPALPSAHEHPDGTVHDHLWPGAARSALCYAVALLGLLLLVDGASGHLSAGRGLVWAGLAVLLFLVLCPARVSAGEGWLASRELVQRRRVRTDLLVSVGWLDGVSQRLVLRDALGGRVEIDPRVLAASPALWHRLRADAGVSVSRGSLVSGNAALVALAERIDAQAAHDVFKVSGLD